ncbi:HAMP domain-containing protein [bacterium]|nr:MAG: HAMP domain-containing protein [bacterium]
MSPLRRLVPRSVRGELMAGATVMIVALGLVAMGNIHHGLAELLRGELTHRGAAIGDLVADAGERMLLTGDEFALHRFLRDTVARNPDVSYAYVRDPGGRIRADSFPNGFPRALSAAHPPAPGRDMRLIETPEEGRIQDVSVPILDGRLGSVHVGMRESRVRGRIVALVVGWGGAAGLVLLAGLGAAYWLTAQFSARIERLIRFTEEVGRGNFDVPAADAGRDEIGRLSEAFGKMTGDLKRSQSDLVRAGKLAAIGELASGVAHEINNPLSTMGVCCQSLSARAASADLRRVPELADFPEYLAAIEEEIGRCKKITSGLLDFARRREPSRAPVQLNEVIRAALPLAGLRPGGAADAVELSLDEDLPPVFGDRDQLHQVFVNLLMNAMDSTPPGGRIRVLSQGHGGRVLARVVDEGPGVPPDSFERVFEPFYTTKRPGKGTGLGLAICRRIVESHEGTITAARAPGAGAEFSVELPAARAEA